MSVTALDNVSLLATMTGRTGQLVTEPTPAARALFAQKIAAIKESPTAHSTFFNNAWLPWENAFENAREWDGYTDLLTTRRRNLGANTIMLDAHDVGTSVTNNPNDAQNELRFTRYRPNYRQSYLKENRDEFIPVTIDTREIMRLFTEGGPDSTNVSEFAGSQITMAGNLDKAGEFHTLMLAVGLQAAQPNLYHVQVPDIENPAATADQARAFAAAIRMVIKSLADFTPYFAPAGNNQTVPKSQTRLVIRQSVMTLLGTLAYSTSFNPEYVFALPEDQVVELPDHYFDRQPALADQAAFIVDAGSDSKYGSLVVVDTYYNWGVDRFDIKSSENRALHHAEILGTNPYKTFITIGVGAGTAINTPQIVPSTVTGSLYGPLGDIANGGDLVRGQEYSTLGAVLDSSGYPAGGWTVEITSTQQSATKNTYRGLYNEIKIGNDDLATSITVKFASILDPSKSVSRTYNIVGTAFAYDGSGMLVTSADPTFAAGSGSGGTITYTAGTGEVAEISSNGGTTWATAGASPITVPTGQTRYFRKRTSAGYVYPNGTSVKTFGPWTAA